MPSVEAPNATKRHDLRDTCIHTFQDQGFSFKVVELQVRLNVSNNTTSFYMGEGAAHLSPRATHLA